MIDPAGNPLLIIIFAISICVSGAEFPAGSINVLTGNSSMIGKELTENGKIRLISFTGSSNVGLEN